MPLLDVAGSASVDPEQIGAIAANVGAMIGFTVTVMPAVVAHCPAAGVKVYVVVPVVFIAGDHVPVMPLFDVAGSVNDVPEHTGAICVKVGVMIGFTVIVNVVIVAHSPVVGVNV